MRDVFYFPKESTLCWVAGYSHDDDAETFAEMSDSSKQNAKAFARFAKVDFEAVHTVFVEKSSRYKYMRAFYAVVSPENVPEIAYHIDGSDWTMHKWLSY